MKKPIVSFLTLIFVMIFTIQVSASVPSVDSSEKIFDFAELLTSEEINSLSNYAKQINQNYNIDIVIVTTKSTGNLSSQEYADDFFDYNKFGSGENKSGILFLLDIGGRKLYISTAGDAINAYSDNYINKMLDNITPYVSDGNYYSAFQSFLSQSENNLVNKNAPKNYFVVIPIGILVGTISILIMLLVHKKSLDRAPKAQSYIPQGGLNVISRKDNFMHTHTSRIAKPKDNNSGGSSSHRSSSGSSHGGGGRSF